jgi:hypothetical protein
MFATRMVAVGQEATWHVGYNNKSVAARRGAYWVVVYKDYKKLWCRWERNGVLATRIGSGYIGPSIECSQQEWGEWVESAKTGMLTTRVGVFRPSLVRWLQEVVVRNRTSRCVTY